VRTIDLEEEYAKFAEGDDDGDMSTVLANVKRSKYSLMEVKAKN